jgi:hypothetical protein
MLSLEKTSPGKEAPKDTLWAFCELQTYLCSAPVVGHPHKDCPFCLIMDASLGDDTKAGGMGAIFTQTYYKSKHHGLRYTNCQILGSEKNYVPSYSRFRGMEHFAMYLMGHPFMLFTDY